MELHCKPPFRPQVIAAQLYKVSSLVEPALHLQLHFTVSSHNINY